MFRVHQADEYDLGVVMRALYVGSPCCFSKSSSAPSQSAIVIGNKSKVGQASGGSAVNIS